MTWSVDGIVGGNSSVGTIDAQGVYTAPTQIRSHILSASVAGQNDGATASIAVLNLSISPESSAVPPDGTQQFTANIQGEADSNVTWSVDGSVGGNSAVGTINASGQYTPPDATGAHLISAASIDYPSVTAVSTLIVQNIASGAVLTYHNDDARDGAFTQETTQAPSCSSRRYGLLFPNYQQRHSDRANRS